MDNHDKKNKKLESEELPYMMPLFFSKNEKKSGREFFGTGPKSEQGKITTICGVSAGSHLSETARCAYPACQGEVPKIGNFTPVCGVSAGSRLSETARCAYPRMWGKRRQPSQ